MVRRPRLLRRFVAVVRSDPSGVGAGFVALLLSSGGDLLAGLTLGAITGTLADLPGLLVLVPAANWQCRSTRILATPRARNRARRQDCLRHA